MSAAEELRAFLEERQDTADGDGACDRPGPNAWMRAVMLLDAAEAEQARVISEGTYPPLYSHDPATGETKIVYDGQHAMALKIEEERDELRREIAGGAHDSANYPDATHWERRYKDEYAIVERVWKAVGVTRYEDTGGLTVDEIVRRRLVASRSCGPGARC